MPAAADGAGVTCRAKGHKDRLVRARVSVSVGVGAGAGVLTYSCIGVLVERLERPLWRKARLLSANAWHCRIASTHKPSLFLSLSGD